MGDPHPHASARSEVAELTGELVRGLTHFCFLATIDLRSNRSTSLRTLRKVLEVERALIRDTKTKLRASGERDLQFPLGTSLSSSSSQFVTTWISAAWMLVLLGMAT